MVVVDGRAHFVKSSHKRGHQTSLFLVDEMEEVIKLLEEHFNCRVIATCTDNASAPIGAQKIIKERRPYMITLHFQAHSLQLLCKAAFKVEPCLAVAAAANKIANLLPETDAAAKLDGLLSTMGKRDQGVKKPNDTRWNSLFDCMASCIGLKDLIHVVLPCITDAQWASIEKAHTLLSPMAVATDAVQADNATLLTVLMKPVWSSLATSPPEFATAIQEKFAKRLKKGDADVGLGHFLHCLDPKTM